MKRDRDADLRLAAQISRARWGKIVQVLVAALEGASR